MGVDNFLDGAGKVLEAVPELYEDGAKGTVVQTGKLLERIPRLLNALAADFDIWMMNREAKVKAVSILIDKKLEGISEEKIVNPEPYIAVPALQAIGCSMDSEEIRDMYANLLSKAMNSDNKNNVHPAFVEIIKQMSPREASNMEVISKAGKSLPIAKFQIYSGGPVRPIYKTNYQEIFLANPHYTDIPKQCISINVLLNLGLIEIDYGSSASDRQVYDAYDALYDTLECKETLLEADKLNNMSLEEVKRYFNANLSFTTSDYSEEPLDPWKPLIVDGRLNLTPFGREFAKICLN